MTLFLPIHHCWSRVDVMSDPRKGGCNETPQVGAQICPGFMKAGNIQHQEPLPFRGFTSEKDVFGWNVHEMTGPYGFIRLMNHYLSSTVFKGSIPKTWWDCDAKMSVPCCAQKIWKYMFLNRTTGNWNRWALNSLYIHICLIMFMYFDVYRSCRVAPKVHCTIR